MQREKGLGAKGAPGWGGSEGWGGKGHTMEGSAPDVVPKTAATCRVSRPRVGRGSGAAHCRWQAGCPPGDQPACARCRLRLRGAPCVAAAAEHSRTVQQMAASGTKSCTPSAKNRHRICAWKELQLIECKQIACARRARVRACVHACRAGTKYIRQAARGIVR